MNQQFIQELQNYLQVNYEESFAHETVNYSYSYMKAPRKEQEDQIEQKELKELKEIKEQTEKKEQKVQYRQLEQSEHKDLINEKEQPGQVGDLGIDLSQFTHANFPNFVKQYNQRKKLTKEETYYQVSEEADLEDYLRNRKNEETFSTKLLKYIDLTGLADSEVYKRAGIDRRHFSKIRCNKEYQPKKSTAISLCLALKLSLKQVDELLELAGYTLTNSDTADLIVKFCIEKEKYSLMDVNEALVYFGQKALGAC